MGSTAWGREERTGERRKGRGVERRKGQGRKRGDEKEGRGRGGAGGCQHSSSYPVLGSLINCINTLLAT